MKWTNETIEKEIRKVMKELNIVNFPTTQELRENGFSGLSRAINLSGGMYFWSNKINVKRREAKSKWTEEKIKKELLESIKILSIDRMPTAEELKNLGRNDLHCKVSRTKKYSGWAEELGLELKESHTTIGQKYEKIISGKLEKLGYECLVTSTRHPYDLLINNSVKVDVKAANVHYLFGSRAFTFGINKPLQTSDIYILVGVSEDKEIERVFVIPSHLLQMKTLNVGLESKYNKYIDAWHYLKEYTAFYESIK